MDNIYDLAIVGAGPAGYTAALHAAQHGENVILFEKDNIGGICLNKGCIPTKSILRASEIFNEIKNCQNYGITAENVEIDYSKIIERKNRTVETLRKGIELALKNAKVTVIKAKAEIINKNTIKSNGETFKCDKIICASGSAPKEIKGLEFDHEFILSSDDILNLEKLPQSILIIGSGAIGTEWARIFNNFGIETTVVELAPHLLPIADIEVSKRLERIFKTRKIKFYTETYIKEIHERRIMLSNGETIEPEIVLAATGRTPNKTEKIDGVKYIGDAAGDILLAHYAIKQAIEITDNIPFKKEFTPSVVYGSPEIAWIGKREQDLEGSEYKKSLTLISSLGKAHCDGQTEGFIKILTQNDEIVGAHIVSNEASALIGQFAIAMQNNISASKLKEVCFAHPTYSEGIFDGIFKL